MWLGVANSSPAAALLTASFAIQGSLADCVPRPIAAKVGNVSLTNGDTARGIAYSVGTPAQDFAFLPQWGLNNILLYGINGKCSTGSAKACTTTRGGQYDKVASSSRAEAEKGQYPTDPSGYPQMDYITDVFKLDSNTTLKDVPMGISFSDWGSTGYTPMMGFGMGSNSTILRALTSGKKIASRTWSFFYGWTGDQSSTQLDGNWVWGGYDQAKVEGDGHEFPMSDDNGRCVTRLLVEIANMQLNFANGTSASLFPNSTALKACLVPFFPVMMSMPLNPFFQKFEDLTRTEIKQRSFGIDWYSVLYDPHDTPYSGDMTFTFKDGPTVRVPNDQLIHAERTVDEKSGAIVANASAQNILINPLQDINSNDLPQLGRQFFSSAYVLVNEDTRTFKLWAANPTKDEKLVAIDKEGNEVTDFCQASAPKPPSSSAPEPSHTSADSGGALSGGAIGGIAVGAVAGVALIAAAAFFLWRRRRGQTKPELYGSAGAANGSGEVEPKYVYAQHKQQNGFAELAPGEYPHGGYYQRELPGDFGSQRRNTEHYEMAG